MKNSQGTIITSYWAKDAPPAIPVFGQMPKDMRPRRAPDRKAIKGKRKAAARNRRRR